MSNAHAKWCCNAHQMLNAIATTITSFSRQKIIKLRYRDPGIMPAAARPPTSHNTNPPQSHNTNSYGNSTIQPIQSRYHIWYVPQYKKFKNDQNTGLSDQDRSKRWSKMIKRPANPTPEARILHRKPTLTHFPWCMVFPPFLKKLAKKGGSTTISSTFFIQEKLLID